MQSTRDGMRRIVVGQGCSLQVSRDGGEYVRMLTKLHIKPSSCQGYHSFNRESSIWMPIDVAGRRLSQQRCVHRMVSKTIWSFRRS